MVEIPEYYLGFHTSEWFHIWKICLSLGMTPLELATIIQESIDEDNTD